MELVLRQPQRFFLIRCNSTYRTRNIANKKNGGSLWALAEVKDCWWWFILLWSIIKLGFLSGSFRRGRQHQVNAN